MKSTHSFPDHNQNFWQLTSIQSASQSIPGILIGGILTHEYGAGVAISSICIGNLILWLIGLGVISIAAKERRNAIESVGNYLGHGASLLMALIMIIAFMSWYMLELQAVTRSIKLLFPSDQEWGLTLFGSILGTTIALLSMGGIRLIKSVCVVGFPFLLIFILSRMFVSGPIVFNGTWGFSFPGVVAVFALTLSGTVNLPTFFRHSHSRADSLLALTLNTVFTALFQIFSVFTGMAKPSEFLGQNSLFSGISVYALFALAFILVSSVCLNLVNIYFSSAALQTILPKLPSNRANLLVGLMGTGTYLFLQTSSSMIFLENMANNFIANIGITLLLSFLVSTTLKHRPKTLEKSVSFFCVCLGCLITLILQIIHPENPTQALLGGFSAILIAFLCILFFEQTIFSIKKIVNVK